MNTFIKIINEENQEVYINLEYISWIIKSALCTKQPIITFFDKDKGSYYWVFQDEKSRNEAFDNLFKE